MKRLIRYMIAFAAGIIIGIKSAEMVLDKPLNKKQDEAVKFQSLFQMMGMWMEWKQKGINIAEYFEKQGYQRIGIYGMGLAGQALCRELRDKNAWMIYGIDRNKEYIASEIEILSPEEPFPELDVIVVTAISYYEEILNAIQNKVNCTVISLEDIIYSFG